MKPLLILMTVPALITVGTGAAGLVGSAAPAVSAPVRVPHLPTYQQPVPGPLVVLTAFSPPAARFGRGHLGVDLAAKAGAAVLAAGAGQVRFAGPVAGRDVVVIAHPDGLSTEYEPVAGAVRAGEQVRAGQVIGRLVTGHASCAPASCLHWGARRGTQYVDPLVLLRPLGVVRLLPWSPGAWP